MATLFLHTTLVLLYANVDINSRVASTIPLYYFALAQLAISLSKKGTSKVESVVVKVGLLHNLLYTVLNVCLFIPEIGFV